MDEMLTISEAAEVMGVVPQRVTQLAGENKIPNARRFGRSWMIPEEFARAFKRDARGWPRGRKRK